MTCIILNDKFSVLLEKENNANAYVVCNDIEFEACDATCFFWDARGCQKEGKEHVKDALESCCLLSKLNVIDLGIDLVDWLDENFKDKFVFHMAGENPLTIPSCEVGQSVHPNVDIVVSNVCWNPKDDAIMWPWLKSQGITKVNIALSMYGPNVNVHFAKDLKDRLDIAGMQVHSLNALFYNRTENIFNNYYKFIVHFKKMLELAHLLGAKCVIYGSPSSKYIQNTRLNEYDTYKKGNAIFVSTLVEMSELATTYGLVIHLKPNKNICNFMFDDQQVGEMINVVNHQACIVGPARLGPINSYPTFDLIEFPSSLVNDVVSLQHYILALTRL